jgi:hypothetical protein
MMIWRERRVHIGSPAAAVSRDLVTLHAAPVGTAGINATFTLWASAWLNRDDRRHRHLIVA